MSESVETEAAVEADVQELARRVEVVLMAIDHPLPSAKIADLTQLPGAGAKLVTEAVASLNKVYETSDRSFRIEKVAGGWQILSLPAYAPVLAELHKSKQSGKLSVAAMETLAIIAYKQPVLRAQIEAIRGVASGEVIKSLMERRLIKIVGRAEELGRPMLYGTTRSFLEAFGLSDIKDLPKVEELKTMRPA
ncbi:MAG: SMC-Scp complex subunit ScpB [Phycisphaeraceae bacterium]|nr:SMC-Scp complex subunit ScpB [Phycisphaeraceae bacterium]